MDANKIPTDPMIKKEWVKYQLRIRGSSFSKIARKLGLCRQAPQIVLTKPYPRIEKNIGDIIGVCPQYIWPERYEQGKSKSRPKRPNRKKQ